MRPYSNITPCALHGLHVQTIFALGPPSPIWHLDFLNRLHFATHVCQSSLFPMLKRTELAPSHPIGPVYLREGSCPSGASGRGSGMLRSLRNRGVVSRRNGARVGGIRRFSGTGVSGETRTWAVVADDSAEIDDGPKVEAPPVRPWRGWKGSEGSPKETSSRRPRWGMRRVSENDP